MAKRTRKGPRVAVSLTVAKIRVLRKSMTVNDIAAKFKTTRVTLYRRFGSVLKASTKARRSK